MAVHSANGYIINQFLDSTANKRTDQWGGSVENRARFVLETLKAVKESFGDDVALKLNPTGGYNDMGYSSTQTYNAPNLSILAQDATRRCTRHVFIFNI